MQFQVPEALNLAVLFDCEYQTSQRNFSRYVKKHLIEHTPELLWGLCEFLCSLAFFFQEVCYAHYLYSYARIAIHTYVLSTFFLCVAMFVIWSLCIEYVSRCTTCFVIACFRAYSVYLLYLFNNGFKTASKLKRDPKTCQAS